MKAFTHLLLHITSEPDEKNFRGKKTMGTKVFHHKKTTTPHLVVLNQIKGQTMYTI